MTGMDRTAAGARAIDAEKMIAEARKAFFVMFALLAAVWLLQLANAWKGYVLSRDYGIVPGEAGSLPDILSAPFLHWSWEHIQANSGPLFVFGFLAAYRGVVRFLGLSLIVAVASGLTVWIFESGHAVTAGASGLVFGYFGYVVVRGLFDRHLIDTLIGIVMAASFAYLLLGVVPGTPGVSWLGHLGGLVGGVAGGWLLRERGSRPAAGAGAAAARTAKPGRDGGELPAPADGSRADLHKELKDLGLL